MLPKILSAMLLFFSCNRVLGQTESASPDSIPVVTVCEALHNRVSYNDKSVIVIGKIESTVEGVWLKEDCSEKITTDGVLWGGNISLTVFLGEADPPPKLPKDFSWDDKLLLKKLKSLKDYSQFHRFSTWAAVFGRFETRISPEYFQSANGRLRGLGFGHLNSSLAQIVFGSDGFHELKEKEPGLIPESNDSPDHVNSR